VTLLFAEARSKVFQINGGGPVAFDPKEKKRFLLFLKHEPRPLGHGSRTDVI
jgi:hypothetical protein